MRTAVGVVLVLLTTTTPALASGDKWSPQYFFGMGFVVRKSPSELGNLARRDTSIARTADTSQALFDHDAGLRWRAGLELGSALFVAIDTGIGVTALPEGPQMSEPWRRGSSATVLGVAGLRGNLDHTTLAVELAGGVRQVSYCVGQSFETHDDYSAFQEVAEVRVRGQRWLGAQASIGATLGTSLLDRGAWVGALDITFHLDRSRGR